MSELILTALRFLSFPLLLPTVRDRYRELTDFYKTIVPPRKGKLSFLSIEIVPPVPIAIHPPKTMHLDGGLNLFSSPKTPFQRDTLFRFDFFVLFAVIFAHRRTLPGRIRAESGCSTQNFLHCLHEPRPARKLIAGKCLNIFQMEPFFLLPRNPMDTNTTREGSDIIADIVLVPAGVVRQEWSEQSERNVSK